MNGRKINDSLFLPKIMDLGVLTRLTAKMEMDRETGCWVWQACKDEHGYGKFWWAGKSHWAHRIAYAIFNGPIEAGLTIDHKCMNRACCNPNHLEAVTKSENSLRRWQ